MKIKSGMEEDYKKAYDNNTDPYGHAVFTFLERWAELMEKDIKASGNAEMSIEKHAEELSYKANTEGITGFMYGCAVNVLAHCWEYGEILRKWHNHEYHYDGDGVVNPAILTIG